MRNEYNMAELLREHRQAIEGVIDAKRALADVERKMLACAPKRRAQRRRLASAIKELVDLLRASETPLGKHEVAARLGIAATAANSRLARAVKMQLVEHAPIPGKYRCASLEVR